MAACAALRDLPSTLAYQHRTGTRLLRCNKPLAGGTTSHGLCRPSAFQGPDSGEDVHVQGSPVNYDNYIRALEHKKYADLRIKTGSPSRNRSSNRLGDPFYFSGAHMYEPKYQDFTSTEPSQAQAAVVTACEPLGAAGEAVDYRAATALVGHQRLARVHKELRWRLANAANGEDLDRLFKCCGTAGSHHQESTWLTHKQLLLIATLLGQEMKPLEAKAVFGLYDVGRAGRLEGRALFSALLDRPALP